MEFKWNCSSPGILEFEVDPEDHVTLSANQETRFNLISKKKKRDSCLTQRTRSEVEEFLLNKNIRTE